MKTTITGFSLWSLVFFMMFAYSAQAIEYGQMGGSPTNFNPDIPDSKSWFIYNLDPGTDKEDSLTVANLFQDSWTAVIYAADSIKSSSGGFALRQLAESKEAVGSWVKFYPDPRPEFAGKVFEDKKTIDEVCKVSDDDLKNNYELAEDKIGDFEKWCEGKELVEMDLMSGERKELLFVISIPKDADVGEHTGGILIQKKNKDESAQVDGSKVMLTTRVGIRIYETVPGEIIKKLNFSDFQISKNFDEFYLPWDKIKKEKFNEYLITSVIKNSGNASADFNEKITIRNNINKKTETLDIREFQVLRGDDFVSSLVWKSPRLAYLNFQKEYRYTDSNGDEQIVQAETIKKWFIPWRELVIFIFFALLAIGVYVFWRKYQKKYYGGIGWIEYVVEDGETVQSLLKKFSLDWKVFVKTNKINKPYLLEVGQIVKVPKLDASDSVDVQDTLSAKVTLEEAISEDWNETEELPGEDVLNKKEIPSDAEETTDEGVETEAIKTNKAKKDIVVNEIRNSKINSQPLRKNTDIQKPQSLIALNISETEMLKKEVSVAEKDASIIQGKKDNASSYFKWIVVVLAVIIVILLGTVIYLLLNNKKEGSIANQPASVIEENSYNSQAEISIIDESKEEVTAPEVKKIDSLKMKIEVYNGSGVAGAAGKVKDFLVSKKYENVEARNYSSDEVLGSFIYYKEDEIKEEAQWLADMLKEKNIEAEVKLATTDEEKSADVVIILGK